MAQLKKYSFVPVSQTQYRKPRQVPRLSPHQWQRHKATIEDLYLLQDKTLDQLVDTMRIYYGLDANHRQYTQKFKTWCLYKNKRRKMEAQTSREKIGVSPQAVEPRRRALSMSALVPPLPPAAIPQISPQRLVERPLSEQENVNHRRANRSSSPEDVNPPYQMFDPGHSWGSDAETLLQVPLMQLTKDTAEVPWQQLADTVSARVVSLAQEEELQRQLHLAIWGVWLTGRYRLFHSVLQAIGACSAENHTPLKNLPNTFFETARSWAPLVRHEPGYGPDAEHFASIMPNANMIDWRVYAAFARQIASHRTTVPLQNFLDDAWQKGRRMIATMTLATQGSRALRLGFQKILHHIDNCLRHEEEQLTLCCKPFQHHCRTSLYGTTGDATDELSATLILAMICYERWLLYDASSQARDELVESLPAGFDIRRAFLWAARLLLHYATPGPRSMLPPDICARATTGSKHMLRALKSHAGPHLAPGLRLNDEHIVKSAAYASWKDAAFISLWVEWIISDTEFFKQRAPPGLMFAGLIL